MSQAVRTKIFYFTGTGNSLLIAKAIASELKDAEIVRITQNKETILEGDCTGVGLIFPVYYGGLPSLVQKFLPTLKVYKDSYVFGVATYAGGLGRALSQLRAELQEIGLDLSSGFRLRMPQNYIMAYDVPDDDKVAMILARAQEEIPTIVDVISSKQIHRPVSDFPEYSSQSERYNRFIAKVKDTDTRFWCDDNCTECGICVRICPVQNIVLDNGRPRWLHKCEMCLGCLNWCPEESIQYGEDTSEKGRYTNPHVSRSEIER